MTDCRWIKMFPHGWTSTTLCVNISMGKLVMGLQGRRALLGCKSELFFKQVLDNRKRDQKENSLHVNVFIVQ